MPIPAILFSKLPGFLVVIEEFLKGGSRFENEVETFVFHKSNIAEKTTLVKAANRPVRYEKPPCYISFAWSLSKI